ncbi:MAG TPA: hypothetical protein VK941_03860, partial [Gillisia sp.]|nr:hypothetical protein [Gillisia sp.]
MENRENTPQEDRPLENEPLETTPQESRTRESRVRESKPTGRKNIWNLILGIIFLGYGSYRLYVLSVSAEGGETLSYVLAIAFVIFG